MSGKFLTLGAAVLSLGVAAAPLALQAEEAADAAMKEETAGVKVGVLTCNEASGWGYVFGSSKKLKCTFRPNEGSPERYTGSINKYGVDVGYTESSVVIWGVIAPTSDIEGDSLEGDYGGISAEASAGIGVGANALIGGFDKSITLQPLSVEGQKGINLAAGITQVTLTRQDPAKPETN